MKISKPEYLEKAMSLAQDEQQRVLSRMTGKLPNRLIKEKLSMEEAIAIQLEIEDEQLAEWRKNWEKIRKHEADKKAGSEKKLESVKKSSAKASAGKAVKVSEPAATQAAAEAGGKPVPVAKTKPAAKSKPASKTGKA